jgi:hypothetical protein
MMDVIQDDGLIFAEGDRDNLYSDHGRTYCSYLLLKKYLNESVIFSRYTEVPDIFTEKAKDAPVSRPSSVPPAAPEGVQVKPENLNSKLTEKPDAQSATF